MTREASPAIAPPAQDALRTSREMLDRRPSSAAQIPNLHGTDEHALASREGTEQRLRAPNLDSALVTEREAGWRTGQLNLPTAAPAMATSARHCGDSSTRLRRALSRQSNWCGDERTSGVVRS